MSHSNREKSHSKGSDRLKNEAVKVLHSIQRKSLGNASTNPSRSNELLEHPQEITEGGGNRKILQFMESAIIKASNQKYKGLGQQKAGGKQERSPSSFYKKASSQPTSPRRGNEQEKKNLRNHTPPVTRCHGTNLQHGQNLDEIQGKTGARN
ncbi:hypothetical protein O181_004325 [Austropuccinia psidii MF-1]|uniref:Uncharacterized protein n=1 Tax=Austropuccinia psidii MF-1 TaxID=1389203 RepID=A0A9Q3BGR3_9BASI|nr:hypothetical protein [Austropuccinia psidii MF-1]